MVLSCVPKSVTTHAPLCNTNNTNKPKIVKILAVKGLSLVHIQINFESFKTKLISSLIFLAIIYKANNAFNSSNFFDNINSLLNSFFTEM